MSDNNTVMHEGNVYEIGKHYLFGNSHQLHRLLKIDKFSGFPFRVLDKGQENGFTKIRLFDLDTGTITPAPIYLIDGNAYMFDVRDNTFLGFYRASRNSFFYEIENGNKIAGASECTNIRPMTVAESK
tara:strand:- start:511 stop:894 length:384 start_codon:yes stop_codon:yes gene_type:complete